MRELFIGVCLILLGVFAALTLLIDMPLDLPPPGPPPDQAPERAEPSVKRVPITLERRDRGRTILPDNVDEFSRRPSLMEDTKVDPEQVDDAGYFHYVLRADETLADLARRYLGRESLWTVIRDANPDIRTSTDMLPGRTVRIPLWLRDF